MGASGGGEVAATSDAPTSGAGAAQSVANRGDQRAAAIGQPTAIGDAVITIVSVETTDAVGSQYVRERASQGATYVVVNYTLRNNGNRPLSIFEAPDMDLVDGAGVRYDEDAGATSAYIVANDEEIDANALSNLNPGVTTRDADVYEIATDRFNRATWQLAVGRQRFALQ